MPSAQLAARDDGRLHRRHRRPRPRPARRTSRSATETIGPIIALIAALIERGHAYAVEGDVYFRVRSDPRYGELSHRAVDDMDQGEGVERRRPQGGPARLRALEGAEARRGHRLGLALGPRAARLAHRVLGDGRGAARRRLRHPRRRHRPGLPPPRERDRPDARPHGGADLAQIWMHNGMLQMGEEKMAKSVGQHRPARATCSSAGGATRSSLFFSTGPLPPAAALQRRRRSARRRRSVRRIREAARRLRAAGRRRRTDLAPLVERFFDALADDFNTPRALRGAVGVGARGEQARAASGDAGAARDADRARASRRCSTPDDEATRPTRRRRTLLGGARGGPRRPRLGARPTACATSWPRSAGRCATPPDGPGLVRAVILYGRNAVHEALRARRRRVHEIWATASVVEHEPWVREAGVPVHVVTTADVSHRSDSEEHQGICAEVDGYPYVERRRPARAARPADRRARRGPGPAEPRRDLPHGRGRGGDRRRDPRAARRRGHAVGLQGLGRRGRAAADRAGPQPRRLPRRRAEGAAAWCYGAAAVPEAVDYLEPDWTRRGRPGARRGGEGPAPARRRVLRPARARSRCAATSTR